MILQEPEKIILFYNLAERAGALCPPLSIIFGGEIYENNKNKYCNYIISCAIVQFGNS